MIFVSKSLPRPVDSALWSFVNMYGESYESDPMIFTERASNMYQLVPSNEQDAYTVLIRSMYEAQRHMFVDQSALLASWRVWDPVLQGIKRWKPYYNFLLEILRHSNKSLFIKF